MGAEDAASMDPFPAWLAEWWRCATFDGSAGQDDAIERICKLYDTPIGDGWHRLVDSQLLTHRYRRGDVEVT